MPNNAPRAAALVALLVLAAIVVLSVIEDDPTGDATPVSGAALLGARRTNADATPPAVPFDPSTPRLVLRARRTLPHDTTAFTQGLLIDEGRLVESTGLEGRSAIRELDPVTGAVTERATLAAPHFGEGIAVVGQRLYQLTWRTGRAFVYDAASFALMDSLLYVTGWLDLSALQSDSLRRPLRARGGVANGIAVDTVRRRAFVTGKLWPSLYEVDLPRPPAP